MQPTLPAKALKRLFRSAALINSRAVVPASVKRAQVLRRYMLACCRDGNIGAGTRVDYHEEEYRWQNYDKPLTVIIIYDVLDEFVTQQSVFGKANSRRMKLELSEFCVANTPRRLVKRRVRSRGKSRENHGNYTAGAFLRY